MKQETAEDMIKLWDSGSTVHTIRMGGMGPGYEQVIQTAMIELLRDNYQKELPTEENWETWGDSTLRRIDDALGGLTGAMWGAARVLAYDILKNGWLTVEKRYKKERLIMVSKTSCSYCLILSSQDIFSSVVTPSIARKLAPSLYAITLFIFL